MVTSRAASEAGFTLTELMVALAVLLIGFVGVLKLSGTGIQATAFTRAHGEATTLAQDKMEALRTLPATTPDGSEQVDALGVRAEAAPYTRSWVSTPLSDGTTQIHVQVSWNDGDGDPRRIDFWTVR